MTTPTTTAGVPPTGQRIVLTTVPGFANTDEGLSHMAALAAWLRSQGEAVDQDWLMGGSGEAFAVYYHPDGTFLTPFVHTWDVADAALGLYGYRSAWESGSLADIADELRAGRPVIAPGIRPSANGVNSRCHYWFVVSGADLEKGTVVLQGAGDAPLETWPPRGDGPPEGKHPCWHGILRTFAWGKPQHYGPDGDCPVLRISEAGPVPDRAAVVRQALARAVALHREGTTVKAKRYGGGAYLSGRTALQRLHDDLLAAPGDGLDDFRARYHTKDDPFGGLDSETCHLGLYAQRREAAARFLAQAAPLLPEAARPYLATAAEHCTKAAAEARAVHTLRCGSEEEQRAMAALVAEDAIADNAQWDAYWEKCDTALASAANRRTMAEHVARMIAHEDEAVAALQEALSRPTAMVAGVARLRWGRDNTFINALTVAATAMGDDVTYADLMGASGAAFRVQIHRPDWCPSAPDAALGFSCVAQAVQACGYTVEQIVARDDASKATLRAAVVASIDQGWPVVAIDPQGSGDYGIIAGYTQGGARFLWRTYADKDDAYGEGEKWPLTAYVIRERGPAPARAALAKAALARAGEMLRAKETSAHILRTEEEQAKYLVGAAAYQAWVNRLCSDAQCTQPDERARKHAMHANAWMYLSLLDARAAAADYLRGIAPDLPEAGRAHVLAAADVYGRIAEALRAGRNNAPHDWQHPVTAWTRERREAQADLLRRIAAQERLAVFHLDRALAALDGREAGAVLLEDAARIYHEVGVEVAGIHQPRSEVISRMVALRAAGLPADYATLVTLEGYGTSFAYHPRKFSAMYQPITHAPWEPDARTEAATGLQWRGTGKAASADDAFRIVKAEVDAGRPVGGQWLDDLLFLGYRDAARPDDRQVYVAGGWDEPGWWSWTRFSEWAAKWGLVRNLGPTPTIPVRDTAMAVMRDMVAWTTRDPRPSTEPTYGLASMAALAGDLADPAKTAAFWSADMRGCHGINRQVFGRSCAAAYLRGVAPEFPADARAHIRAAADHYADAWAAWQAWARELGYLSGGMDAADLERTWGDMARRTKGAALVRTAAEHERLAAEALARALALLG